jgi:Holliday junction resolvase RusA-like endonuclease
MPNLGRVYHLIVPVEPMPAPRVIPNRRGRAYYPAKYNRFRTACKALLPGLLRDAGLRKPLKGPVVLAVDALFSRPLRTSLDHPKPDEDNILKAIQDAMNGLAWVDDCQVIGCLTTKRWAEDEEGFWDVEFASFTGELERSSVRNFV